MKKFENSKVLKCGSWRKLFTLHLSLFTLLFAAAVIPARDIPPDTGFIPVDFPEVFLPKAKLPETDLPKVELPKINTSPVILPKGEYL